eukprot:4208583-Pyramimonas_sp.AAC.1
MLAAGGRRTYLPELSENGRGPPGGRRARGFRGRGARGGARGWGSCNRVIVKNDANDKKKWGLTPRLMASSRFSGRRSMRRSLREGFLFTSTEAMVVLDSSSRSAFGAKMSPSTNTCVRANAKTITI